MLQLYRYITRHIIIFADQLNLKNIIFIYIFFVVMVIIFCRFSEIENQYYEVQYNFKQYKKRGINRQCLIFF